MSSAVDAPAIAVRPAHDADWVAVERLLAGAGLPTVGAREHLADFLVAEATGQLIGTIGLERYTDGALLRSAAVDAAWRGRGVGARMAIMLIEASDARGDRALYLLTETAESWFPKFGFERIERALVPPGVQTSVEFTGACPASAVAMRRHSTRARVDELATRTPEGLVGG